MNTQAESSRMKIGEHLTVFTQELKSLDAVERKCYFRGGIKVVQSIIDDVKKEYELCPRLSNFAYENILLSLKNWLKEIESLESQTTNDKATGGK